MNILLSAFACDPALGSEAAVGWTWACELARQGHRVCVLTRHRYQASINSTLAEEARPNLRFVYFDLKRFPYKLPLFGVYAYYFFWQLKAWLVAATLFKVEDLDCIHHLTYASCRTFFFLSWLPVPSIYGPVGGGESAPLQLLGKMSLKGKLHEYLRTSVNFLLTLSPVSDLLWRRASLNLVTTEETLRMVPGRYRSKTRVLPNIAAPLPEGDVQRFPLAGNRAFRLLYVGRLLEWKGVHLAIEALKVAVNATPNLSLTILGEGESGERLKSLTRELGLEDNVSFLAPVSRVDALAFYSKHDALILPSLHDSGGTVVLEAFSRGTPVISLKLGGPGVLVDASCGASIDTEGLSVGGAIESLAATIVRFSRMNPDERQTLQGGAFARARQFQIDTMVRKAYEWFEEVLTDTNPLQANDQGKQSLRIGSAD